MDQALPQPVPRDAEAGASRRGVPRSAHAAWPPVPGRDPFASADRPTEAMRADPLGVLRDGAARMAADLATLPSPGLIKPGLIVHAVGDAHLENFAAQTDADGTVVFDVLDFAQTGRAPFEWDLKRLATSLVLAGRREGLADKACRALARRAAHAYQRHVQMLTAASPLEAWRSRIDLAAAIDDIGDRDTRRAERLRLLGPARPDPRPEREGFAPAEHAAEIAAILDGYAGNLEEHRRLLFARYRLRDILARPDRPDRALALLIAPSGDRLHLTVDRVGASALDAWGGVGRGEDQGRGDQGRRVVVGQRILQAAGDEFLGWAPGRDAVVRRYQPPPQAGPGPDALPFIARMTGLTLARGHARSGDPEAIAAYLGEGDAFETALGSFAISYADQVGRDHAAVAS